MAAATRNALGEERLNWLGSLPRVQTHGALALVHASPENPWQCPPSNGTDAELETVYAPLAHRVAVHGHILRPYVRALGSLTVVNTGRSGSPMMAIPGVLFTFGGIDPHDPPRRLLRRA